MLQLSLRRPPDIPVFFLSSAVAYTGPRFVRNASDFPISSLMISPFESYFTNGTTYLSLLSPAPFRRLSTLFLPFPFVFSCDRAILRPVASLQMVSTQASPTSLLFIRETV